MKKDEIDVPVKTKETLNTELRYQQMLRDKVEEIRRICVQEQIPCFMAFGLRYADQELEQYNMKTLVENKDVNSDFLKTTAIIPEVLPINFTDRRFISLLVIRNDFYQLMAHAFFVLHSCQGRRYHHLVMEHQPVFDTGRGH